MTCFLYLTAYCVHVVSVLSDGYLVGALTYNKYFEHLQTYLYFKKK